MRQVYGVTFRGAKCKIEQKSPCAMSYSCLSALTVLVEENVHWFKVCAETPDHVLSPRAT